MSWQLNAYSSAMKVKSPTLKSSIRVSIMKKMIDMARLGFYNELVYIIKGKYVK